MLLVLQSITPLMVNPFIARLNEGGPLFMYTTLFILIVIIALLINHSCMGRPRPTHWGCGRGGGRSPARTSVVEASKPPIASFRNIKNW